MTTGANSLLPTDIANGVGGHAAKHNAVNDQVNYLTKDQRAEVYVDFTTKANGAAPATADTGQTAAVGRNSAGGLPVISGGRLVAAPDLAVSYATYYQIPFDDNGDGVRVGCTWTMSELDSGDGCATLGFFDAAFNPAAGSSVVPISRAHLVYEPGTGLWKFSVGDGAGHLVEVATGTYTPLAADGTTRWRAELVIDTDEGTAYLYHPDGTSTVVTAAQVAAAAGFSTPPTLGGLAAGYAFIEHYAKTNGATAKLPRFTEMWAEAATLPRARRSVGIRSVLKLLSRLSKPVRYKRWSPTAVTTAAVGTSTSTVDSTNAAVTGYYGPTGVAIIEVDCYYEFTGTETVFQRIGIGSAAPGGSQTATPVETVVLGVSGDKKTVHHRHVHTGGIPGTLATFYIQHSGVNGGVASLKTGGANGAMLPPIVMTVVPA